jgi:heterodisulfide reductase subunit A-like polyferredoxin
MSLRQHNSGMENSSGANDPVWVATLPFSEFPAFPKLTKDIVTDILVVGTGITGISTAYELVEQGQKVTLIDSRNVLSGETARTSGHLSTHVLQTIYFMEYLTYYIHRFSSR